MNWQAINYDWNQVRAFLATVEEGSLSAAARVLGLTQPTLGRQVAGLEERLGVTLFERSGRKLILTPSGLELAEHVRAMGAAATQVSLVATGQSTSVEGVVRITASEMHSARKLPEFVSGLRQTHPGIVIDIVATNSLSDLRLREADIAIRNTEPTDSDLIAKRIGNQRGGLYAVPALLDREGPFRSLEDLSRAPFVGFGADGNVLTAMQKRGIAVTETNIAARSENHLVHWALCRAGVGIGLNAWSVGDQDTDVVRVLDDLVSFEFPVWLVAPKELRTSRRVRIVFDALSEFLTTGNRLDGAGERA